MGTAFLHQQPASEAGTAMPRNEIGTVSRRRLRETVFAGAPPVERSTTT